MQGIAYSAEEYEPSMPPTHTAGGTRGRVPPGHITAPLWGQFPLNFLDFFTVFSHRIFQNFSTVDNGWCWFHGHTYMNNCLLKFHSPSFALSLLSALTRAPLPSPTDTTNYSWWWGVGVGPEAIPPFLVKLTNRPSVPAHLSSTAISNITSTQTCHFIRYLKITTGSQKWLKPKRKFYIWLPQCLPSLELWWPPQKC